MQNVLATTLASPSAHTVLLRSAAVRVPLECRHRFVEALFLSFKLGDDFRQIHLDSFSRLSFTRDNQVQRANSIDGFENVMREPMFSADVQDQTRGLVKRRSKTNLSTSL
jgi:hypothetical protein